MTIGERIKNRRIELNMTQQQLADKLGYKDRSAVCQVERDKNNTITTDRISAFASALDVSPSYLMGWSTSTDANGVGVEYADPEGRVKRGFIEHAPDNLIPHAISDFEFKIITAYRSHPEVQGSILKLLDLEEPAGSGQKESVPDGHIDNSNLSRSSELTGALKQSEQTA